MIVVTVDLIVLMLDKHTFYFARPVAHAPRLGNAPPTLRPTEVVLVLFN
jgi:hypothetical protein